MFGFEFGLPSRKPQPTILDFLNEALGATSSLVQEATNHDLMQHCTVLWRTRAAAVATCPGFDDFFVWPTLSEEARVVEATTEVIADFEKNVLPALDAHGAASSEHASKENAQITKWALTRMYQTADGSDFKEPKPQTSDAHLHEAHVAAVQALRDFLGRHSHTPLSRR